MYVCAWDDMHVRYISSILASLTWSIAAMSAPFSKSREQVSLWPLKAALCNAVWPIYKTQRQRKIGQVKDKQKRMDMVQGQAGYGRSGKGGVTYGAVTWR